MLGGAKGKLSAISCHTIRCKLRSDRRAFEAGRGIECVLIGVGVNCAGAAVRAF